MLFVEPESFCEYFSIEDEGPKKASRELREEIRELYGHACYACGATEKREVLAVDGDQAIYNINPMENVFS